jgi:hypothetical protein
MMGKRDMLLYKHMAPEDRRTFDWWLSVGAVVGSIFAAAFLAMALAQSDALGPAQASAKSARAPAAHATKERGGAATGYQIVF